MKGSSLLTRARRRWRGFRLLFRGGRTNLTYPKSMFKGHSNCSHPGDLISIPHVMTKRDHPIKKSEVEILDGATSFERRSWTSRESAGGRRPVSLYICILPGQGIRKKKIKRIEWKHKTAHHTHGPVMGLGKGGETDFDYIRNYLPNRIFSRIGQAQHVQGDGTRPLVTLMPERAHPSHSYTSA